MANGCKSGSQGLPPYRTVVISIDGFDIIAIGIEQKGSVCPIPQSAGAPLSLPPSPSRSDETAHSRFRRRFECQVQRTPLRNLHIGIVVRATAGRSIEMAAIALN
jgi:hypothetical protein